MRSKMVVGFVVGCVSVAATRAQAGPADEAAKAFAEGRALLAGADFDGAANAFKTAARIDKENREYRESYAILRQVVRMRAAINKDQGFEQWEPMARALRTFYYSHGLYSEAISLDERLFGERPSVESAAMLAETQLALGMNSEALETLDKFTGSGTTPRPSLLKALALARQGRVDDAKAIAARVSLESDGDPKAHYEFARVRALLGDTSEALAALATSFRLTPPGQLDARKADAQACPEFAALVGTDGFSETLRTRSAVEESSCSQGASGCGSCPQRATCAGASSDHKQSAEGVNNP